MFKKLAIAFGVLVIVAVGAALVFVATLDINEYRGVVAAKVEELTGRKLEISGALELAPSLRPTVTVRDVRYANADWGTRPLMVTAARLEVRIALLPLLSRRLEIHDVGMFDVDVLLETDPQGRANWDVVPDAAPAADTGVPAEFKIDTVRIERLKIAYRDGASGQLREASVTALSLSPRDGLELEIAAEAAYGATPIGVAGRIGRLNRLVRPGPYPLDLGIRVGAAQLGLKGTLERPLEAVAFDLTVKAEAPDLAVLSEVAATPLPSTAAIAVEAGLAGEPRSFTLSALSASVGKTRLTGNLALRADGDRPRLEGKLSVPMLDLDHVSAGVKPAAGADDRASVPRSDRVFSDQPLPLDSLRAFDAALDVSIERLVSRGVEANPAEIRVALDDGFLRLAPIDAQIGESTLTAALELDARAAPSTFLLRIAAPGLDVGALIGKTLESDSLEGKADLDVAVTGHGESVAAVMGSLDGHARLLMAHGRVKAGKQLEMLVGGVSALFGTMTKSTSEWTKLNCVAADFEIDAGIASKKVLLVDTEFATVVGEGSIDLGKETIAMKVTPSPKSVTLNVAVPVKVGGTLANPTFKPDELATARRIGGVAAMLFPPAAIASLGTMAVYGVGAAAAAGDVGSASDHPCLKLAAGEAPAAPAAEPSPPSTKEKAARALKGIGKSIKGLFGN